MEKKLEGSIEDNRGNIILENRKKMTLTGVEEVISFDDEKILLNMFNHNVITDDKEKKGKSR